MTAPETPRRPPRRPLNGVALLLPVLLGGGVLTAYLMRPAPAPTPVVSGPPIANTVTNASDNEATLLSTPRPGLTRRPHLSPGQFSVADTVYVPGSDDKLHSKPLPSSVIREQKHQSGDRTPALNAIIKMAPAYYPRGARVLKWDEAGNDSAFVIDVNPAFADDAFWSQSGETTTQLAIYALVNSVTDAYSPKGPSHIPVRFTVEGKPIETLGEFDASDAIKPDMSLVKTS